MADTEVCWPEAMSPPDRFFSLWGIDGELRGNEGRVHACLPFFSQAGDDRVFAARAAGWRFEPPENLKALESEEVAAVWGTRLVLNREVPVAPGQVVVLWGPVYFQSLRVFAEPWLGKDFFGLPHAQESFRVICLEVASFEKLARIISTMARKVFDEEVKLTRGREITAKAEAALSVLRNTGLTLPHDQMIRALLADWIQKRPDAYRKSLKVAALRLKQPLDVLEEDMHRHLKILVTDDTEERWLQVVPRRGSFGRRLLRSAFVHNAAENYLSRKVRRSDPRTDLRSAGDGN